MTTTKWRNIFAFVGVLALWWATDLRGQQAGTPLRTPGTTPAAGTGAGAGGAVPPLPDGNQAVEEMNDRYIKVWRALMAPKNVADSFGRRIATRYIAIQLTVANRNTEYQWLIQDASVDLSRLVLHLKTAAASQATCQDSLQHLLKSFQALGLDVTQTGEVRQGASNPYVTSADLTVLRGVAEKGQALDPRNLTYRLMRGAGTIAAGMLGVTTFGPAFAPAVAGYNGPLLTAYQTMFPDFTVNQLNRLNDSAFLANTLVPKQQARVIVIFMPMEYVLTRAQVKKYYKDPESVFGCPDLRLLEANVNGNFITTVVPTPVITSININTNEEASFGKDNFTVGGVVVGRFLEKAKVALLSPPDGVTVAAGGEPSESRLQFVLKGLKPLMPGQLLEFQVSRDGTEPAKSVLKVLYQPERPTLQAGALSPSSLVPGSTATVTVKGGNFLPDEMQILVEPPAGLRIGPVQYISNGELKVEVTVADAAAEGPREFRVSSKGGLSDPASTLTVKKPAP